MTSEKKVGYHPGGSVPRRSRTTSRRRPTGRTVYKSRTTIPTRRVAKPTPTTQTSRQKAIAAVKARSAAKRAEILKNFNSLTPAQKTAMKQKQQAKALSFKQRQGTNQATPTKTTGTLGNPTSAQKKIIKNNSNTAMQKAKPLSAPQKQMPRTTPRVGSTVARRRAAMARRRAAAMARRRGAAMSRGRPTRRKAIF